MKLIRNDEAARCVSILAVGGALMDEMAGLGNKTQNQMYGQIFLAPNNVRSHQV